MSLGRGGKWGLVAVLLLATGSGIWFWSKREVPSYESRFADYIWIEYPPGHFLEEGEQSTDSIDKLLREREQGYLGGITSRGEPPEIVEVELAVALEALAAQELMEELKERGLLPEGIKFEAGTYPRVWSEP